MSFTYDAFQTVLTFADMRLTHCMQRDSRRCATVNEYAAATGISVTRILDILNEPLTKGDIDIEAVGGEIFVHTAPQGRPTPAHLSQVPPNLWEILRRNHDPEAAFAIWRIGRDLETSGWNIESDGGRVPTVPGQQILLGLRFTLNVVPVIIFPSVAEIETQGGLLTKYELSGVGLCAFTCLHHKLERSITGVRHWMLGRPSRAGLDVIILEAPHYQPVLLTSDDGGISPRSTTITMLQGEKRSDTKQEISADNAAE